MTGTKWPREIWGETCWKDFAKKKFSVFLSSVFLSEETTFLSPAENLFKVYAGVETFVMFIGYPRSSHSLVGAILDAHPEIVIPHEFNLMAKWKQYQSSILKEKNLQKNTLFYDLHHLSKRQAMFGIRAGANSTLLPGEFTYTYNVPDLWQGGYQKRIKVIVLRLIRPGSLCCVLGQYTSLCS